MLGLIAIALGTVALVLAAGGLMKLRRLEAEVSAGESTREICDLCERESAVGFTVPNQIWGQVLASIVQPVTILCVGCFTALADSLLLPWDDDITFWPVSKSTFQQVQI